MVNKTLDSRFTGNYCQNSRLTRNGTVISQLTGRKQAIHGSQKYPLLPSFCCNSVAYRSDIYINLIYLTPK